MNFVGIKAPKFAKYPYSGMMRCQYSFGIRIDNYPMKDVRVSQNRNSG